MATYQLGPPQDYDSVVTESTCKFISILESNSRGSEKCALLTVYFETSFRVCGILEVGIIAVACHVEQVCERRTSSFRPKTVERT